MNKFLGILIAATALLAASSVWAGPTWKKVTAGSAGTATDPTKVAKTGDTMTGPLSMSSNKITNLATPTNGTDAANKAYVDAAAAAYIVYPQETAALWNGNQYACYNPAPQCPSGWTQDTSWTGQGGLLQYTGGPSECWTWTLCHK